MTKNLSTSTNQNYESIKHILLDIVVELDKNRDDYKHNKNPKELIHETNEDIFFYTKKETGKRGASDPVDRESVILDPNYFS